MKDDRKLRMPLNIQFFADGDAGTGDSGTGDTGAGTLDGLDGLLDQMTSGSSGEQTQTDGDNGQQQQTPPDGGAGEKDPPEGGDENNQQQQQTQQVDKQAYAFAQMRTQNAQLVGMLSKMAQANGIEFSDQKDLITKLNDDAINKLATKQNVPVELLKEVEDLRAMSNAVLEKQRKDEAAVGFQSIMTKYGLSQDELKEFAVELDQQGKNPFEQKLDLEIGRASCRERV